MDDESGVDRSNNRPNKRGKEDEFKDYDETETTLDELNKNYVKTYRLNEPVANVHIEHEYSKKICFFCNMNQWEVSPDKKSFYKYPVIPPDQYNKYVDEILKAQHEGNLDSQCLALANEFNWYIVCSINKSNENNRRVKKLPNIEPYQLKIHFTKHIETLQGIQYENYRKVNRLIEEIYDNGVVVEHKDGNSNFNPKTKKPKKKFKLEEIKVANSLFKTSLDIYDKLSTKK